MYKRLLNPKMTPDTLKSIHWIRKEVMKMSFSMSADVYNDLTVGLALKKYPIMTLKLPKSAGSKETLKSIFMSADVYSDVTIGLALKNYPKMTHKLPKSIHWIRSDGDVFFHIS